jgi:hypothetical protein
VHLRQIVDAEMVGLVHERYPALCPAIAVSGNKEKQNCGLGASPHPTPSPPKRFSSQ